MAVRVYVNNVSTRLTSQLLAGGTTANVTAGDGALFAGANGSDWIIGTLRRMSGYKDVAREIVKITNRSTDALTITRAQESTTALQFEIGDQLDVDFTASIFTSPDITTSITTPSTTFSLVNTVATTVNFAGAATTLSIGAATGTLTVNNATLAAKAGTFTSGKFGFGSTAALTSLGLDGWNSTIQEGGGNGIAAVRASDNDYGGVFVIGKAKGTLASPTAIADTNTVGTVDFVAHDGTSWANSVARIRVYASGTIGTNITPGKMSFMVTPASSRTPAEAMSILPTKAVSMVGTVIDMVTSGTTLTVGVGANNGTVSAGVFTDRSVWPEGDATAELLAIKGKNGHIDHDTLPAFARANVKKTKWRRDVVVRDWKIIANDVADGETVDTERDLGAMISMLTVATQQMAARLAAAGL